MATLRRSAITVTSARWHLDEVVVKVNGWRKQN
jgi:transposase-like protein